MNQIHFNQTGGFPLETDTLHEMQTAYSLFHAHGNLAGDLTILKGCEQTGNTVTSGVVHIQGETLNFAGGTIGANVFIRETLEDRVFENGEDKPVFMRRSVVFGTSVVSWRWADFKRITPNTDMQNMLTILMTKITELEKKNAVFTVGGGMVLWNKPANVIPSGWREVADWKGRMPVGAGVFSSNAAGQNVVFNLGATGGDSHHKNTINEMAQHTHPYSDIYYSEAGGSVPVPSGRGSKSTDYDNAGFEMSRTTGAAGSGQAYSIMNPYRVVLFIEYTGT